VKKDQRHRARESALQILYQWDVGKLDVDRAIETFFALQWPDAVPASVEFRQVAGSLVRETVARLEAIDALVAVTAERWRPERMAIIDRLILRMAIAELMRGPDIPHAVVINEALELARTFSTEDATECSMRCERDSMLSADQTQRTQRTLGTKIESSGPKC
jgi:N utilization substance protein B